MSAHPPESASFRNFAANRIRQANYYGHDMTRDDYQAGNPEYGHWTCARCGANLNIRREGELINESITSGVYEKCRGRR